MPRNFAYCGWRRRGHCGNGLLAQWRCIARNQTPEAAAVQVRRYLGRECGSGFAIVLPAGEHPHGRECAAVRYESGIVSGALTPTNATVLV